MASKRCVATAYFSHQPINRRPRLPQDSTPYRYLHPERPEAVSRMLDIPPAQPQCGPKYNQAIDTAGRKTNSLTAGNELLCRRPEPGKSEMMPPNSDPAHGKRNISKSAPHRIGPFPLASNIDGP